MASPLTTEQKTRVAIVDDNVEILRVWRLILDHTENTMCVGTFHGCAEAFKGIPRVKPDVVLMDLHMPGVNGIDCTRRLKTAIPALKIIMLAGSNEPALVIEAMLVGADGYLVKPSSPGKINEAIRDVHAGGGAFCSSSALQILEHFRQRQLKWEESAHLTPREHEVLEQLTSGRRYKEIADQLHIGEGTVRTHVHHLFEKMEVTSRTEAVVKFLGPLRGRLLRAVGA